MADEVFVVYHSHEWEILVETGWITISVNARGIARMVKAEP